MLAEPFVKTPHQSNALLMSLLNKFQELWLTAVALTLLLSFLLALTATFSSQSSRRAIHRAAKKAQGALTNINGFCAFIVNTFYAHRLMPSLQLPPQLMSYSAALEGSLRNSVFGSSQALRTTPIGLHPKLLLLKVSYRLLLFFVSNFISSAALKAALQV